MNDLSRGAMRLGCAVLVASAMSLVGCTFDSAGNMRWTNSQSNREYAQSRKVYWNGHHGEPTVRRGGIGLRPQIDTSKLTFTSPK